MLKKKSKHFAKQTHPTIILLRFVPQQRDFQVEENEVKEVN